MNLNKTSTVVGLVIFAIVLLIVIICKLPKTEKPVETDKKETETEKTEPKTDSFMGRRR